MSRFSTLRGRPVYFGDAILVDGDTALCTLVEDFDHTTGKVTYSLEVGDTREARRPLSYNSASSRPLCLVEASGIQNFDRFGDQGRFSKIRGSEV